jgi:KDO2-lipid IV(A) lauroyltransferase
MPALGFRGYKINQVAGMPTEWIRIMGEELTFVDRKLLQLEHKNDQHLPAKFIYVFRYMRAIYRCLDRNEIVCFAVDGGGGSKREGVDLLGRKIMLSKNPFKIANRANATILPAFVIRKPNNFHELVFEESIQVASDLKKNRDSECLKAFVRLLETYIQRYPCHYLYRMGLARSIRKRDPIPLFTDYEKVETV